MSSRTESGETCAPIGIRTAVRGPRAGLPSPGRARMSAAGQPPPGRTPPRRRTGPSGGAGQDGQGTENPGWTIFSSLLAGMAFYGGIGWLIGRWAGHQPMFLAGGMIVGLALAVALTIFRYGRS